ncbi:MAG: riboflavin synthase subunit alpha [Pseudomonadales bacterium]|nr:riboflavin synthase subunit alpha [Pseudomonadales bacterium]
MFTGIVQDLVSVQEIVDEGDLIRLVLDMGAMTEALQLGASVAVNGTCLTVTRVDQGRAYFDVITESLRTTNLDGLSIGDLVNVERSYHVGDEIGGHIISGHVTSTAPLTNRTVKGHDHVLRFELEPRWLKYVFHKGFIGLDGASITVSSLHRAENWFEVSLIPETLSRTTLGQLEVGDLVNIEVDGQTVTTVETVERVLAERDLASETQELAVRGS